MTTFTLETQRAFPHEQYVEQMAQKLREHHSCLLIAQQAVRLLSGQAVRRAWEIGNILSEMREVLGPKFRSFLESESLPFSRATAYRYIGIFNRYSSLESLPPDGTLLLEYSKTQELYGAAPHKRSTGKANKTLLKHLQAVESIASTMTKSNEVSDWDAEAISGVYAAIRAAIQKLQTLQKDIENRRK